MRRLIVHKNLHRWGVSYHFICANGAAICSMSIVNDNKTAYIHGLSVIPEKRKHGYATWLLFIVEAYALTHCAEQLHVNTEPDVISYYSKRGFAIKGDAHSDGTVTMCKNIWSLQTDEHYARLLSYLNDRHKSVDMQALLSCINDIQYANMFRASWLNGLSSYARREALLARKMKRMPEYNSYVFALYSSNNCIRLINIFVKYNVETSMYSVNLCYQTSKDRICSFELLRSMCKPTKAMLIGACKDLTLEQLKYKLSNANV